MKREPKPGEMWGIVLGRKCPATSVTDGACFEIEGTSYRTIVHEAALHPLSPAITPEAQAVLDAAITWDNDYAIFNYARDETGRNLRNAVATYISATFAPPDPVKELRNAWVDWNSGGDGSRTAYQRLEHAIAAIEKGAGR